MMSRLLLLVPEEAFALLLMGAGIMMILGWRRTALKLIAVVLLFALLGPFIDAIIDSLPFWMLALLLVAFIFSIFRLLLGRRVVDNVISFLIYDLIRAPFRILWWVLTRPNRRA